MAYIPKENKSVQFPQMGMMDGNIVAIVQVIVETIEKAGDGG